MDTLLNDVRFALRLLSRSPGFTAVAVLSIALGIGVNTAVFTLVDAVLLRPLPVAHPEGLVEIYTTSDDLPYSTSSYPDYLDLRREASVFEDVAGHSLMFAPMTRDGRSRVILGEVVTANYFDVLGVQPALGRNFLPEEDQAEGARPVTILSHGLWMREFGGDPGVIGRTVRLRGLDYSIVGVAPASFTSLTPGFSPALWVPTMMVEDVEPMGIQSSVPSPGRTRIDQRGRRWLFLTARVKPGISLDQVRTNVDLVTARLEQAYPDTNRRCRGIVVPRDALRIHPMLDGAVTPGAALLMAVVGLVLLVACANVANMLLARAASRQREIAVRLAVGAARARLVRQLLTESLVLAILGGAGGLVFASISTDLLLALQPPLPFTLSLDLGLDGRVFAFAFGIAALSGVLFGLAPALQASTANLVTGLKDDVAPAGSSRRFALRNLLVIVQVGVSMVLLVTATLFVRSLAVARATDLGFDPGRVALAAVDLDMLRYPEARSRRFFDEALARLRALPGIEAASITQREPLGLNVNNTSIYLPGQQATPENPAFLIDSTQIGPDYFETLGVPVLLGRGITSADTADTPSVVVISDAMARRFWPNGNAVGQRIHTRGPDGPVYEIVGVSADYKVRTVGEAPRPYVHFAHAQRFNAYAIFMVRGNQPAAALVTTLRQTLLEMEPDLVIMTSQPLETSLAATLFPARAAAVLLGAFSMLALALASVGLYGVVAYSVSRRTREIGIRLAIGAGPGTVLRLVLRQGLTLVWVGVVLGGGVALWATRLVAGVLYGVGALDFVSYAAAAILLLAIAAAANLVPALRAANVDPVVALRQT